MKLVTLKNIEDDSLNFNLRISMHDMVEQINFLELALKHYLYHSNVPSPYRISEFEHKVNKLVDTLNKIISGSVWKDTLSVNIEKNVCTKKKD